MKNLPDFSEYLVGERLINEERIWAAGNLYQRNAANIIHAIELFDLEYDLDLIELGCGSGWVPTVLPLVIHYLGIDKSPDMIEMAHDKNDFSRVFLLMDIRKAGHLTKRDLACSFAVLKHFSVEEFPAIFGIMLNSARHGVFNIKVSATDAFDSGTEYHDSWVTSDMVMEAVKFAGKTIAKRELIDDLPLGYEAVYYIKGD